MNLKKNSREFYEIMNNLLTVIVGPTAVGKTEISIEVAKRIDGEIVSADSMQIYRYMDIGTAKPSKEEQKGIKHYMIDIINPDDDFSVADYQYMAKSAIDNILLKRKKPILTGGTGLYINAVCYNYTFSEHEKDEALRQHLNQQAREYGNEYLYNKLKKVDPVAAAKIHPNNLRRIIRALEVYLKTGKPFSYYEEKTKKQKPPYKSLIFGITMDREELYQRINRRVEIMIERGLIKEVRKLLSAGYARELNSMQSLGYRQIVDYLDGKLSLDEAVNLIARDTRRYAKRQYTWFLRDKNIIWCNRSKHSKNKIIENIITMIEGNSKYS